MNLRMTKIANAKIFDKELDVLGTQEEPLFKAASITALLGESNPSQILKRIPDELRDKYIKKIRVTSGCATHDVLYLTEFGVYLVLMRSRQPQALKYQLKIAEMLKSIRLNGYALSDNITADQMSHLKNVVAEQGEMIKDLEESNRIKAAAFDRLCERVTKLANDIEMSSIDEKIFN